MFIGVKPNVGRVIEDEVKSLPAYNFHCRNQLSAAPDDDSGTAERRLWQLKL